MLACRFCRWVATRHRRVTSTGGDQWSTSVCGVTRQQGQVSGRNAWGEKLQMRSLNEGSCQRRDTVALLRRRRRGNSVWEVCVNAHISSVHTGYLQPQKPWESFQLWQNHEKSCSLVAAGVEALLTRQVTESMVPFKNPQKNMKKILLLLT